MDDKQVSLSELQGVSSLLGIGEVECDKCGKMIRYLDRYCYNTRECPICGAIFNTMTERDGHFGQQHPHEPSRGTRYCAACSLKAGYLKMVKNTKTGEVFLTMFPAKDEEVIEEDSEPSS